VFTTTVGLEDVEQVRFGSLAPVPLPPAAGLFIIGCAGLLALTRRRRHRTGGYTHEI
jgi:hypothetical protein